MTPAPRNDDGEVVEPPNSTVDDWLGQQVSQDEEEVDNLLEETDGNVEEAERRFPGRSHQDRPDRCPPRNAGPDLRRTPGAGSLRPTDAPSGGADIARVTAEPHDQVLEHLDVLDGLVLEVAVRLLEHRVIGAAAHRAVEGDAPALVGGHVAQ